MPSLRQWPMQHPGHAMPGVQPAGHPPPVATHVGGGGGGGGGPPELVSPTSTGGGGENETSVFWHSPALHDSRQHSAALPHARPLGLQHLPLPGVSGTSRKLSQH